MLIPWKWERLDGETCRYKVINGWIVLHWNMAGEHTSVFVPDEQHIWKI